MCVYLQTILETVPTVKGSLSEGTKKVFQAFAKDIDKMDQRIKSIDSDIQVMKDDILNVKMDIANLDGKMDTVIELIEKGLISNSSNDNKDRMVGAAVNNIVKSKKFWVVFGAAIGIIMLSGVSIMYIIHHAHEVVTLTEAASKLI